MCAKCSSGCSKPNKPRTTHPGEESYGEKRKEKKGIRNKK